MGTLVFGCLLILLAVRRHWAWLRPALTNRRTLLTYLISAVLLTINWFTYIWAVNAGFIIESSLGYFITPLVNVLLGVVLLGESLRRGQLLAIVIAVAGVAYLTISYGAFPWIALTLAFSFGFYGLMRKKAPLDSTEGLTMETLILFLPAFGYLLMLQANGTAAFAHSAITITVMLALTGLVTGLPLLLFGAAARRITLTNLGLLQYLAPTLQFLIGIYLYNEPFTRTRLIGFGIIWIALIVYSAESLINSRKNHLAIKGAQP